MSTRESALLLAALLSVAGCSGDDDAVRGTPHLGRPAPADVVRRQDISVLPDGTGLPPGSGTVAQGRATFAAKCAVCHGEGGAGGAAERLTGGIGTLASSKPIRSVASYWPYAPVLFDYIRRAMPLTAPQSLTDREVYGLAAYLLSVDGIVGGDVRMDAVALSQVKMPNRDGFVSLEPEAFDGNIDRVTRPQEK